MRQQTLRSERGDDRVRKWPQRADHLRIRSGLGGALFGSLRVCARRGFIVCGRGGVAGAEMARSATAATRRSGHHAAVDHGRTGRTAGAERLGHRTSRPLDDRQRGAPAGVLRASDAMARKPRHLRRRHLPREVRCRVARPPGPRACVDRTLAGRLHHAGSRLHDAGAARSEGRQGASCRRRAPRNSLRACCEPASSSPRNSAAMR